MPEDVPITTFDYRKIIQFFRTDVKMEYLLRKMRLALKLSRKD
jgi:hypothetical protein